MLEESRQGHHIDVLSRLVIPVRAGSKEEAKDLEQLRRDVRHVAGLNSAQWWDFFTLANDHHVSVRALTILLNAAAREKEKEVVERCENALSVERVRIERAVGFLHSICGGLQARGCKVAVIKSLDHWPDLGSDLDLYTTADDRQIEQAMREDFRAQPVERSWGDRLANKWNYSVPGLPELVEIHVQYLGQTGEHAELARRVIEREVPKNVGARDFMVPAPEERIVISSLQRVYRHFYFRLCDMIDTASLLESGAVDFSELKNAADSAGIWPGVASYLSLVQNYIQTYGGVVSLPEEVKTAAYSPESTVQFKNGYLRVSKATAFGLYSLQLLQAGRHGDLRALLRLPLLPPLAISALVAHSLTGNDKGIW
jgi:hypothetical protein